MAYNCLLLFRHSVKFPRQLYFLFRHNVSVLRLSIAYFYLFFTDTIKSIEAKLDDEVSTNIEQMTMIKQLATNLTKFADEAIKIPDNGVLMLRNTMKKLEAIVYVQNNSILDNSAQINQLQTDVSGVQNEIQSHMSVIEKLEGNHVAGNATANDHSARISVLALEQTVNLYMLSNQTDIIEQLEKNLKDQNASIQKVNEKVQQLEFEHELDRSIVTELKAKVRLIGENVTTDAIILQNYSSQLNVLGEEMILITERIHMQDNNHEQLKENITAYSIDTFVLNTRLNVLEVRTNNSETTLVDHDNRIGQIELRRLSEITLNEEQKAQIHGLEEEMNKTWSVIQGFSETSLDPAGKR